MAARWGEWHGARLRQCRGASWPAGWRRWGWARPEPGRRRSQTLGGAHMLSGERPGRYGLEVLCARPTRERRLVAAYSVVGSLRRRVCEWIELCGGKWKRKKTRNESILPSLPERGTFPTRNRRHRGGRRGTWGLGSLGKILLPTSQAGKFSKIFGTFMGRQILNQIFENPHLAQFASRGQCSQGQKAVLMPCRVCSAQSHRPSH